MRLLDGFPVDRQKVREAIQRLAEPILRVLNVVLLAPVLHGVCQGLWLPGQLPFVSSVILPTIGLWCFQTFHLLSLGHGWSITSGANGNRSPWSRGRLILAVSLASLVALVGLGTHEYLSNRCRLSLKDAFRVEPSAIRESRNTEQEPVNGGAASLQFVNPDKRRSAERVSLDQIAGVRLERDEVLVPLWLPEQLEVLVSQWEGDSDSQRLRAFVNAPEVGQSNAVFAVRTLNSDVWAVLITQAAFVAAVAAVMAGIGTSVSIARAFLLESARHAQAKRGVNPRSGVGVSVIVSLLLVGLNMFLYWSRAGETLSLLWLPPHIKPTAIVLSSAIGMVVFQLVFGVAHLHFSTPRWIRQLLILTFMASAGFLTLVHFHCVALCVIPVTVGGEAITVPSSSAYLGSVSASPLEHQGSRHEGEEELKRATISSGKRSGNENFESSSRVSGSSSSNVKHPDASPHDLPVTSNDSHESQQDGTQGRQLSPDVTRVVYVPLGWPQKLAYRIPAGLQDSLYSRSIAVRMDPDWFSETPPNLHPWAYASTSMCFGLLFAGITVCFVAAAALTGDLFFESLNPVVNAAAKFVEIGAEALTSDEKHQKR